MTSRTLSINLLKGELKRKLWRYVVTLLVYILIGPMSLLMRIDNMLLWSGNMTRNQFIREISSMVSIKYELGLFCLVLFAITYAFAVFGYLYNRGMVDMYHSLAIKRTDMFKVFALEAVVPFKLILIITTLLNLAVLGIRNLINGYIVGILFSTLVYYVVFFLLVFLIAVVAIMITGNRFMGMFGTIGLFLASTIVTDIFESYKNFSFQSYQNVALGFKWISYITSPISQLSVVGQNIVDSIPQVIVTVVELVLLTVLALYLYKIRPSECTHQALCYKVLDPVIRMPIVILGSLFGGIYVVYISGSLPAPWYVVSLVGVGIVAHILINSIIKGDVKKSLKNWPQLIISLVVAGAIGSIFLFDLTGFDRYLPNKDKVESVAVNFSQIDGSISNFEIKDDGDGAYLEYTDFWSHRLGKMNSTDIETVYNLAKTGIEHQNPRRSAFDRNAPERDVRPYAAIEDKIAVYPGGGELEEEEQCYYVVKFHLKSGCDVVRSYTAPISSILPELAKVYNSKEYKDTVHQLKEYIEKKPFAKLNATDIWMEDAFTLTGDDIYSFLEALDKDYDEMTLETITKENPVAAFSLFDKNDNWCDGLSGYFIYPSSVNSINWLKSHGIEITTKENPLNIDQIQTIEIDKYGDEYNDAIHLSYNPDTGADIINAIYDVMVIDSYTYDNTILKNYDYTINIVCNYINDNGYLRSYCVRVPKGSLPSQVYDDLNTEGAKG